MDKDGVIDGYIYEYTYTEGFWLWKEEKIGRVYIYVNVNKEFFDDAVHQPEGFNENADLMIGDFTTGVYMVEGNPSLYAYQAQKVNAEYRDEIIEIMILYDEDFNTDWERTEDALMLEWEAHDKYALFDRSAKNIDFDNLEADKDMEYYDNKAKDRAMQKYGSFGGFAVDAYNQIFY